MKKHLSALVIWVFLLLSGYCYIAFFLPLELPSLPSSTIFLDNKWQEIGEIIYSGSIRHRETSSGEIPDFYKKSLVTLEDRTFWSNNGVSLRGIARSMLRNIQAGSIVEWGTTLSSGLIRNTFWIGENRTAWRKILEFLYAMRLNHLYSKDEILTEYIDRVDFGYLNYGLGSAAKYYFAREPKDLTKAEQIALLILPKDSRQYDPYRKPKSFRSRFEKVVDILIQQHILNIEERNNILNENLNWNTRHGNPLPYVTDFLKNRKNGPHPNPLPKGEGTKKSNNSPLPLGEGLGVRAESANGRDLIRTTFDRELTEQIDALAKNTLSELAWKNVSDYGILVAERSSLTPSPSSSPADLRPSEERGVKSSSIPLQKEKGLSDEVNPLLRVMIGGANYTESTAWQVNTTLALRQPGSAIKPFTYLLAFEKLGLTPESTILDLPTAYKTSENYAYEPKNYTQDYKGEITLRQALSESVNIPAVKLAEKVWVPVLLEFLRWLGITSLQENADHYGLGLTLGNGEVSLLELLQAYTVFANDGEYCPFRLTPSPSPSEERGVNGEKNIPLLLQKEKGSGDEAKNCKQVTDKKYTDMVTSILTDRYAKLGGFPLYSALDFPDRNVFVKTGTSRNFRDNWAVGFTDHYMIGVWTGNKSGEDMKGVTGATGAGEIFRRIVYALEKQEEGQSAKKPQADTQEYLAITNPLEDSLYQNDPRKNTETQKIRLHFETNISYDSASWMLDGAKVSGDFVSTAPGKHTVEVVFIRDGTVVGKEKNAFVVE